jgi:hypothetical protein
MDILFIGDIVGKVGRKCVQTYLPSLIEKENIDFVIANGENVTHGKGISEDHLMELFDDGIDVVTLGNHYAAKKDIFSFIDSYEGLLRPNNLHHSIPGTGTNVFRVNDKIKVRVTNLLGQVYMNNNVSNPFDNLEEIIKNDDSHIHIVDFHAEATGEKYALAYAFDGKISCVLGTHTHIQTSDAHLLPQGTGIMSDVGMCGPYDSILGVNAQDVVKRTWTGYPSVFNVKEDGDGIFNGVILHFDDHDYHLVSFKPIYQIIKESKF